MIAMIEIKLKSETVFGGDGKQLGTVDIDIQADEFGLPYYSAKTLKGVLREQAEWYVNLLENSKKPIYEKALLRLFGKPDQIKEAVHNGNYDALRFGDAKLSDAIYEAIKKENFHPREVLNNVTAIRSMTSIDSDTGTAQDKSLRQVRVMLPGYIFYAPVFLNDPLSTEEKNLLENSVKLLRHIGIMRHRGKGEVTCSIRWLNTETISIDNKSSKTNNPYITLTIHLDEPLKISQVLGTSDSSHALNHIPGYVIRGALVHSYLQQNNLSPEELDTEIIFNYKYIQFWNGYPLINKKRSIPFAQNLFETKDQSKTNARLRKIYNSFVDDDMKKISKKSPVKIHRHYMIFDNNVLKAKNVRHTSSMHISINGEKSQQNKVNIYRYESIAPRQTFKAVVFANIDHPFITWLKKQNKMTLWLGGSRNSGYGRCTVKIGTTHVHPEQLDVQWNHVKQLYILATSDWIIHNEHGQLISYIDEKWLSEQLGIELKLTKQVINTQISGGYISHWRAYQPMIQSVQAGSIFLYEVKGEGKIEPSKIKKLMEKGVGNRTNEGFGRLTIFPKWSYSELHDVIDIDENIKDGIHRKHPDKTEEQIQLNQFLESLVIKQVREEINQQVHQWLQNITGKNSISSAQWGKLLQTASKLDVSPNLNLEQTNTLCKRIWSTFWNDVDNRTKKKSKLGFDGVKINMGEKGKWALRDFVMSVIEKQWALQQSQKYQISVNHTYWSMIALKLFFQQIVRTYRN